MGPQNRGAQKLTPTGWLAATLAILALSFTSVLTWSAQPAAEKQRSQNERIERVAHTELRLAIQDLAGWFVETIWEAKLESIGPGATGPRTSGLAFPECMLDGRDRAFIAAASSSRIDQVKRGAVRASGSIDRSLQICAAYLDSESYPTFRVATQRVSVPIVE